MTESTAASDSHKTAESIWIEQFKMRTSEIAARVDLQQRNANVFIVLATAITGYLVNFLGQHSYPDLVTNELTLLVTLVPILASVFIWRHVDHDANILDCVGYLQTVVRPALARLAGEDGLQWEDYLRRARFERPKRLTWFIGIGNEAAIVGAVAVSYIVFGWTIRSEDSHAATAGGLYDALLYMASAFTAVALYMLLATLKRFSSASSNIAIASLPSLPIVQAEQPTATSQPSGAIDSPPTDPEGSAS